MIKRHLNTDTYLGNSTDWTITLWFLLELQTTLTKDILALPLKEGGFNIPRLQTKIRSLRLNTLRRLLSKEKAHLKNFTSYFLRISNMRLGTMSLALNYSLQRIDRDIPSFHKELLTAWHRHKDLHIWTFQWASIFEARNYHRGQASNIYRLGCCRHYPD